MKLIDITFPASSVAAGRERAIRENPGLAVAAAHRVDRRDVRVAGYIMTAAERRLVDRVDLDRETGRYFDPADDGPAVGDLDYYWTAYCGGCGEEIDVAARTETQARRIAEAAIVLDYVPINIDRIERRDSGLIYF